MPTQYYPVSQYITDVRNNLRDLVGPPYRYSDNDIISLLNIAMGEIARVRPDIFLDAKYQQPLPRAAPPNDGLPAPFTSANETQTVPIPRSYYTPICWYIEGGLQFWDTDDTQDVRAQAFHAKFIASLMSTAA